jgi:hypothetical protein
MSSAHVKRRGASPLEHSRAHARWCRRVLPRESRWQPGSRASHRFANRALGSPHALPSDCPVSESASACRPVSDLRPGISTEPLQGFTAMLALYTARAGSLWVGAAGSQRVDAQPRLARAGAPAGAGGGLRPRLAADRLVEHLHSAAGALSCGGVPRFGGLFHDAEQTASRHRRLE